MVAEVPEDLPTVRGLFEAVGYQAEQRFADFTLSKPIAAPAATGAVSPVSLDDLLRAEAIGASVARSWERALETLQNRKDQIRGLAIASDTRVEAWALFRDLPQSGGRGGRGGRGRREIVGLGGAIRRGDAAGDAGVLLETVLRVACQAGSMPVTIPRVSSQEIPWERLESIGFQRERTYTRYVGIPDSNTG